MLSLTALALAFLAKAVLAVPAAEAAPAPTAAPSPVEVAQAIEERAIEARVATCKFTGSLGYSSASVSKASCSTIILDSLTVPAGKTLDMTGLTEGTTVIFEGETSFAYSEWEGPLFAVSGTNIKVAGESSGTSILNGNGPVRSAALQSSKPSRMLLSILELTFTRVIGMAREVAAA